MIPAMAADAGPRRILTQMPLQVLTQAHLLELRALSALCDEVIAVLPGAEEAFVPEAPLCAGERLALLRPILDAALPRPPYLLPVKRGGRSGSQWLFLLRALCPGFFALACRSKAERALCQAALPGVKPIDVGELPGARGDLAEFEQLVLRHLRRGRVLDGDPVLAAFCAAVRAAGLGPRLGLAADEAAQASPRRGLFLLRAQPVHIGHQAFLHQAAQAEDELVVVVAQAEASHTARDPATAGERLELLRPVLEAEARGRYHLLCAPYEPVIATNLDELRLLAPPFSRVYTSNPALQALAEGTGLTAVPLASPVPVSGTEVRRRIAAGEPFEHLLPAEAIPALRRFRLPARIAALHAGEVR